MKLNRTSFPAENAKTQKVPERVKIFGEHFDSPQAQEHYIKEVAASNSRFEQADSNYDFVRGFRGKGSELGFIGGACAGGAFTAYKIAESLVREGYDIDALHGDLTQVQRDKVMTRFREKSLQLLIAKATPLLRPGQFSAFPLLKEGY